MAKVRIAVSVEHALAQRADEVARRSGTPRSRIYARALEEYLTRWENQALLQGINDAYADFPDEEEAATLRRIGPLQERALDSW
jgi:predicted transcriptional regulator